MEKHLGRRIHMMCFHFSIINIEINFEQRIGIKNILWKEDLNTGAFLKRIGRYFFRFLKDNI